MSHHGLPVTDDVDLCADAADVPDCDASSAASDAAASDDGFVHVVRPLMTVRQFTDWVRDVRLPNADAVMQGRMDDDTIQALVSRRTFLRDLLRTFAATSSKKSQQQQGAATTPSATDATVDADTDDVAVCEDVWPQLWAQFVRDLPREELQVDGVLLSPAATEEDAAALAADPAAYARDVVLPRIRAFVTSRINPAHVAAASAAAPASAPSSPAETSGRGGLLHGLAYYLGLAGRSAPETQQPQSTAAAAAAPDTADAATDAVSGSAHSQPPPPPVAGVDVTPMAAAVEGYARLAVLMAQQAVLALPLEIISAQFCADADARLFVGEIPRSDLRSVGAGMRVSLHAPRDGRRYGAMLSVTKTFRVFSLADADGIDGGNVAGPTDYTLFYVSTTTELDLLGTCSAAAGAGSPSKKSSGTATSTGGDAIADHVSLTWRVESASAPAHNVTVGRPGDTQRAQQHQAAPHHQPSRGGRPQAPPRRCECLGAGAGYHKPACHMNWTAAAAAGAAEEDEEEEEGLEG